jgi:hypothetical protein
MMVDREDDMVGMVLVTLGVWGFVGLIFCAVWAFWHRAPDGRHTAHFDAMAPDSLSTAWAKQDHGGDA